MIPAGKVYLKFAVPENTQDVLLTLWEYVNKYGIPRSIYTDKYSVYKAEGKLTDSGRAMKELNIETIYANSPQAKIKKKLFMQDLKTVYSTPTEKAALISLDKLEEAWAKQYSLAIKTWRNNWTHASTFFKYPHEIRRIIYTTNAVEAVHRQFIKSNKIKKYFSK